MYFWNDDTNEWDDYTSTWGTYDTSSPSLSNSFTATDTSNDPPTAGTWVIHFTDPEDPLSLKPYKDYVVKITLLIEKAANTDDNAYAEWEMNLQLRDRCADDTIHTITGISDFEFIIDTTSPYAASSTKEIVHT